MKKIYLFAVAAMLASAAFSQVQIGGQITGNLSSASFSHEEGIIAKKSPIIGFAIGFSAEIPLSQNLSVRSSLGLLQKGVMVKVSGDEDGGIRKMSGDVTNKMYYAELPAHIAFNKESMGGKFFIGAGPSIGYGLFGKSKANYTIVTPGMPTETGSESLDIFKKGIMAGNINAWI